MFPLKDENPTVRKPFVTVVIIVACALMYFGPQKGLADVLGGVFATGAHFLVQPSSTIPVVGASGAIAAIMGAYAIWFPNAPVRTIVFYMVRDISAKWFLGIWFVTQFFTGANSGVAWMAHVGGFVFGAAVALFVRATGYGAPKITRRPRQTGWDYSGGIGRGPLPHPMDNRRR